MIEKYKAMKLTYFFSPTANKKLRDAAMLRGKRYVAIYIHGKEFTEQTGVQGKHISVWDDSKTVHVQENLPLSEFMLKLLGGRFAVNYWGG